MADHEHTAHCATREGAPAPSCNSLAEIRWDEAYNATDAVLIAVEGLSGAVKMLMDERPKLAGPEPETAALAEVVPALLEKHERFRDLRSEEYRAGRKVAVAMASAAIERGK